MPDHDGYLIEMRNEDFLCLCALAQQAAILQGEDIIGGLMKIGAFRVTDVAKLAEIIERGAAEYEGL